jgi:hypothetical protein
MQTIFSLITLSFAILLALTLSTCLPPSPLLGGKELLAIYLNFCYFFLSPKKKVLFPNVAQIILFVKNTFFDPCLCF